MFLTLDRLCINVNLLVKTNRVNHAYTPTYTHTHTHTHTHIPTPTHTLHLFVGGVRGRPIPVNDPRELRSALGGWKMYNLYDLFDTFQLDPLIVRQRTFIT